MECTSAKVYVHIGPTGKAYTRIVVFTKMRPAGLEVCCDSWKLGHVVQQPSCLPQNS